MTETIKSYADLAQKLGFVRNRKAETVRGDHVYQKDFGAPPDDYVVSFEVDHLPGSEGSEIYLGVELAPNSAWQKEIAIFESPVQAEQFGPTVTYGYYPPDFLAQHGPQFYQHLQNLDKSDCYSQARQELIQDRILARRVADIVVPFFQAEFPQLESPIDHLDEQKVIILSSLIMTFDADHYTVGIKQRGNPWSAASKKFEKGNLEHVREGLVGSVALTLASLKQKPSERGQWRTRDTDYLSLLKRLSFEYDHSILIAQEKALYDLLRKKSAPIDFFPEIQDESVKAILAARVFHLSGMPQEVEKWLDKAAQLAQRQNRTILAIKLHEMGQPEAVMWPESL